MKNHSHLFRMNPQAIRRHRRASSSISTLIGALFLAAVVALYWVGKLHTK